VLRDCSHANIVNFVGAYKKGDEIFISMEFCDGGAANDIFKVMKEPMPETEIKAIAHESLKGLQYLHSLRIVHRDIKAANILLCSDGRCKLADFGVAALLANNPVGAYSFIGTPYWMAPEVIDNKSASINPYDMKSDIWSIGIVCLELAHVTPPLSDIHPMKALFQIPLNDPPKLNNPAVWSPAFPKFLERALVKDPKARADADELLAHAWVLKNDHVTAIRNLVRRSKGLPQLNSDDEGDDEPDAAGAPAAPAAAATPQSVPQSAPMAAASGNTGRPMPNPAAAAAGTPQRAGSAAAAAASVRNNSGAAGTPPAAALSASGATDDDDDDGPNFHISEDDEPGDVPTAKEVLNSTVRKATIARTNRPQKQLTQTEEVNLANQIRARKLLKKQMKEIDKIKKLHQQAEKTLELQIAKETEAKLGAFNKRKLAAKAAENEQTAKLAKQLAADKAKLEKKHDENVKEAAKKQKADLKDIGKNIATAQKAKQKELQTTVRREQKAKEDALKAQSTSGMSKNDIKVLEKQQKDALARWTQQRELDLQQQIEAEQLAQEQDQARKVADAIAKASYENLHTIMNLELENSDALHKSQQQCLAAVSAGERERLQTAAPMEVQQLKAKQERALKSLAELHALENVHLKAVLDEEMRYQSRELTSKLRKEEKKYLSKQKKERKKHPEISKRDWKKLCTDEDMKRADKVKKRKVEFKEKMDKDFADQMGLQAKSQEHQRKGFESRQQLELSELIASHKAQIDNVDRNMLQKRAELIVEQQKSSAALVYKQYKSKVEARAAMNKERIQLLAQHLGELEQLVAKHHAAMLPLIDPQQQASAQQKQAQARQQMQQQHQKVLAHAQAKNEADLNKITESFLRMLDVVIAKQKTELGELSAAIVKLGGAALSPTVECEKVKEAVSVRHEAALQAQAQAQKAAGVAQASSTPSPDDSTRTAASDRGSADDRNSADESALGTVVYSTGVYESVEDGDGGAAAAAPPPDDSEQAPPPPAGDEVPPPPDETPADDFPPPPPDM
jgi:serine/threonine-protein kinase 10